MNLLEAKNALRNNGYVLHKLNECGGPGVGACGGAPTQRTIYKKTNADPYDNKTSDITPSKRSWNKAEHALKIGNILLQVFGMDEIENIKKSSDYDTFTYTLSDGMHDVYIIAEYHEDIDFISVELNYGDFQSHFDNLSSHITMDDDEHIELDDKLEAWVDKVSDAWTDAFSY